ncbi:unnamed protein product [Cyprideis torosa]|uniref:Uncharacterized protein n=1 Tax=Cyprideis torosa TaxID=163714 RepID=A0A7R8W6G9_9CRUS|nr:unnamed protein product [Cyprideis torosa]CAG0881323.1 unnamed protein product [Cyprideis torosa]
MVRFVILFSLILYTVAKTAGDKDEESVLEPVPYPEPLAYDDDAFLFGGEAGGAVILGRSGDDDEVVWEDEAGDADTVEDLEDVLREREKALFPLGNEREAGDFQLSLAAKEGSEEAKKEGGERSQDEPSGGFVPPLLLVEDEYSGGRKEDPEKYPANEIVLTNRKPDPLCKPCSSVKMAAPAVSGTNRVPHDDRDKFKLECTAPIPRDKALSKRMTVQWQFSSRDGQNCKVAIQDMKKDLEEIPKHEVHTAPIGLCHTLRPLKNDMELFDREIWTALRGDFSEEMQGTYR